MSGQRVLLLVLLLVLASGCNRIGLLERGPEATITAYLAALDARDWEAAYGLVSSSDRAARTLGEYRNQQAKGSDLVAGTGRTFEVLSVKESGDTAKAEVAIAVPDVRGLMAGAFSAALAGGDEAAIRDRLKTQLEDGSVSMRTETVAFTLVREDQGWRVFKDWARRDRISALLSEAEELKEEKQLGAAIEKFDEALGLDSELVRARQGRDEAAKALEEQAEKQAYMPHLELYDLTAKYFTSYSGKVPGVDFKLKNNGDRTLDRVEVTVYFEGPDGTVLAEESYLPVLVSEFSFSGRNKPLKPNYVWQMERGKFYQAKSVPDEWKEGAATARITDIRFADG